MDSHRRSNKGPLVVGLGEALFDCFDDHAQIGGAPVNLAIHAHSLLKLSGGSGVVASAVGGDPLGQRFLSELAQRGMDTTTVKIDCEHATSRVVVNVDRLGQASYYFEPNIAWDHLEFSESWRRLAGECDAVAFGTLAQRSPKSRNTVSQFLRSAHDAIRLFDVNLRGEFYTADIVRQSFEFASAVKLNLEELPVVCRLLDLQEPDSAHQDQAIELLIRIFRLDWMVLTRGPQGSVLYVEGNRYESRVPRYTPQVNADSVGAGDACAAALVVGALLDWPHQCRVELANEVGAFVASCPGATPHLPEQLIASVAQSCKIAGEVKSTDGAPSPVTKSGISS